MAKILVIEDDSWILLPLSLYIQKEGHNLVTCSDGALAMEIFLKEKPELIILDINLPNRSGIDICREIREKNSTPIIVLSARDSEDDKLTLFELGVDDYVAKPFSYRELMARISAVLKRSESQKKPRSGKNLEFWPLILNSKQMSVFCDQEEKNFTKTEFSILEYCIKNSQNIIKRESIMRDVMWYDKYLHDRTVDTHMKNIRKKLDGKITIETIRGVGYKLDSHPDTQNIS